jgi:hypothetical protein
MSRLNVMEVSMSRTRAGARTEKLHTRIPGATVRGGLLCLSPLLMFSLAVAQDSRRHFALESVAGLRLHNVTAQPATLQGRKGIRVSMSETAQRELASKTREEQEKLAMTGGTVEQLAVVEGLEFDNGVIEAEIAGAPMSAAFPGARGFVGLAFRLQNDMRTYDAFYLRPANGRADDQVRRNHSAQYISHPEWPWFRLRKETPEKYESYVDLVPGEWTKVRIEVRGAQARLFVHDQPQPTLIVTDVKTGATGKGAIALWIDIGTEAHFRNLTVTREPSPLP